MINQLVERSNEVVYILKEHSKQTIVDLWKKMIAYLTIFSSKKLSQFLINQANSLAYGVKTVVETPPFPNLGKINKKRKEVQLNNNHNLP